MKQYLFQWVTLSNTLLPNFDVKRLNTDQALCHKNYSVGCIGAHITVATIETTTTKQTTTTNTNTNTNKSKNTNNKHTKSPSWLTIWTQCNCVPYQPITWAIAVVVATTTIVTENQISNIMNSLQMLCSRTNISSKSNNFYLLF